MGSTSVSEALQILGYPTIHSCPLTHQDTFMEQFCEMQPDSKYSLVSTSGAFGERLLELLQSNVILEFPILILRRDRVKWEASIENMGYKVSDFKKSIEIYNVLTLPPAKYNVFKYDVKDGWRGLCDILGKDIPLLEFPKVNQGPVNYNI